MTILNNSWFESATFAAASQLVGALVIIYFGLVFFIRTLRFLRTLLPRNLAVRYGKGSWVLVTGASAGIGRAFCEELASKGFNIILISENQEDLKKVDNVLRQTYPEIKTKVIVADFANSAEDGFFEKIISQVEGLDISILVNNVGIAGGGPFEIQPEKEVRNLVVINTLPQVMLTRKLLPQLAARTDRSAIIFLSSIMGTRPFPFFTIYSSTKVFADFFARALAEEHPEIDIISLRPVYVSTNMTFNKQLNFGTLTAKECVLGLFTKLGFESSTAGHWRHTTYTTLRLGFIPDWLFKLSSRKECLKTMNEFQKDMEKVKGKTKTE